MSLSMHVLLSADFLNEERQLVFPDIGLAKIADQPQIATRFLDNYKPEYTPDQLQDTDVLLSLKPKLTAASLAGVDRLIAIGRYGVGYDNIDLNACTQSGIAVY